MKADDEGYKQVAEQILYTYHFDAIKELGGVPEDVASTQPVVANNLEHMRGTPKGYLICGLSGFVSPTLDQSDCAGPDWERVR